MIKGQHYDQTYAPALSWTTIRLFLILALLLGWHSRQIDFVPQSKSVSNPASSAKASSGKPKRSGRGGKKRQVFTTAKIRVKCHLKNQPEDLLICCLKTPVPLVPGFFIQAMHKCGSVYRSQLFRVLPSRTAQPVLSKRLFKVSPNKLANHPHPRNP